MFLVSLQHHIQVHHGSPGPQIHIPQSDPHKRPYQHYHDMPPSHNQYPPPHRMASSGYHHKESVMQNGAMGHMMPGKSRPFTGSTSRKQSYKGIVQQNRRDPDMQYVDPPQEFLFHATKDSK